MDAADMAEALAVGKILPGLTGVTMLIFLAPCLRRPIAPLLALVPLMLPGFVIMLVLSVLSPGVERPAWLSSVITGMGVGAIAMLLSTLGPLLLPAISARGGWFFMIAAFVAVGILRWDLMLVLLGLGTASLLLNWQWTTRDSS
jgi:chromate transporter